MRFSYARSVPAKKIQPLKPSILPLFAEHSGMERCVRILFGKLDFLKILIKQKNFYQLSFVPDRA
jgi:hypothetical protein